MNDDEMINLFSAWEFEWKLCWLLTIDDVISLCILYISLVQHIFWSPLIFVFFCLAVKCRQKEKGTQRAGGHPVQDQRDGKLMCFTCLLISLVHILFLLIFCIIRAHPCSSMRSIFSYNTPPLLHLVYFVDPMHTKK